MKHLVMTWRWSHLVKSADAFLPASTVFNVGHFMMEDEVAEKVRELHWYIAYYHVLQWVGEAVTR